MIDNNTQENVLSNIVYNVKDKTSPNIKKLINDKEIKLTTIYFYVLESNGKREKDPQKNEDFILRFIKPDFKNTDGSKRFETFKNSVYNNIFDKYFIPTVIPNTFIISKTCSPYKELILKGFQADGVVLAIKKPKANATGCEFVWRDYKYTYVKQDKNINVKYIGEDKEHIKRFPFGGFNDITVSYDNCFKDCLMKTFDFDDIITDCCISTNGMFYGCTKLTQVKNLVLKSNKIYDMSFMFKFCISLKEIDMSKCNLTLSINNVDQMFGYCKSLKCVNLKDFLLKNKYDSQNFDKSMFKGCYNLAEIITMTETWEKLKPSLTMREFWIKKASYSAESKKSKKEAIKIIPKPKEPLLTITSDYINTFYQDEIYITDDNENKITILQK